MRFLILSAVCASTLFSNVNSDALSYLNELRQKAGLSSYQMQSNLQEASANHTNYMKINSVGHQEDSSKSGYTGEWPVDRAFYEDYKSSYVNENLTAGEYSYKESIDDLFSAIYHRFGFLNLELDEIGISVKDNMYYNYDIGNSRLNELCKGSSYQGDGYYYQGVCKDSNLRVEANRYVDAKDYLKADAPKLILWPPANANDIPPVFYEEHPDPLPNSRVSGYPISVNFNDAKTDSSIKVNSFTLSDGKGRGVEILKSINMDNDSHLSGYQFAIFPKQRLEWGSAYYATIDYNDNGENSTKKWCFETRSLKSRADRFYKITNSDTTIRVVANKTYVIYVVPKDNNDYLGGYSGHRTVDSVNSGYIDQNTITIKLSGSVGEYVEFNFDDGVKIKAVISDSDSAIEPKDEHCGTKYYSKTSYKIAYDSSDNNKFALIMPQINKILTYTKDDIYNMHEIEDRFNSFPRYDNGELCFGDIKDSNANNYGAELMANRCYKVHDFYTQKEVQSKDKAVFLLYQDNKDRLYEGIAGNENSFKVVKDGSNIENQNSITSDDYTKFDFNKTNATVTIKR